MRDPMRQDFRPPLIPGLFLQIGYILLGQRHRALSEGFGVPWPGSITSWGANLTVVLAGGGPG